MQVIEIGGIRFHLSEDEDAVDVAARLAEPLSTKRVGDLLNMSERTVARARDRGDLPWKEGKKLTLYDILLHAVPEKLGALKPAIVAEKTGDGSDGRDGLTD